MSKPPDPSAAPPRRTSSPPKQEATESDGWKSSAQNQRLLHELRVHQIELEMQNEELRAARVDVEAGLKRYTDLYDFAPVGYLTLSPEGLLRELNLPAARLLGRERSRLVANRLRTFVSEATRTTFDVWLGAVFGAQELQVCEVVLLRDSLPPVPVRLEARLSFDGQSGRAVITDITSRRALEEELRQAQKLEAIGLLAGGVAHDFNNILAAMLLNLGILRAQRTSLADGDVLRELDDLAKRAARLTSQLLLFSRHQVVQLRPLELNATLKHLLEMLERLLGAEIVCSFHTSQPELWVVGDSALLEQAVMNLCLNARDAMPNGGQLSLETSRVDFDGVTAQADPKARAGQFACLQVSDSGTGMDAETLKHVFEPFFTTKEAGKGTGLGLAAVFGAILQHHGWVNVESGQGRGTTFRVYLPCVAKPESIPAPAPPGTEPKGTGETVLVVEDEPALLAIVTRSLTRLGYRIMQAVDGRRALAMWEQHADEIDLVLTDMRMPGGLTGFELAKRVRQDQPAMKIILMSGYSPELELNGPGSKLHIEYLAKPFELGTLADMVRRCLDSAPAARAE